MTKDQEIQHLKYFVAGLPRDSYARDALEPFLLEFERGVYSDYVPTVLDSWRHRQEAEKEALEARARLAEVQKEIANAKRNLAMHAERLGSLMGRTETVVQSARSLNNDLVSAYGKAVASQGI